MKRHSEKPVDKPEEYEGDLTQVISTGSTLLDLEISGGRIRGGGIPSGIMVEIFGPSGCGKTVLLCELAGDTQRKGGEVAFNDPEARLNKQFAKMFDLNTEDMSYATPDTVTEVFTTIRDWKPKNPDKVNGIFTDSLAALSTNLEMDSKEGDKMGMRRAKEFSEGFRKNCRILQSKNYLMVCSNQVRQNHDAGPYGVKYSSPGGEAIGFYSSLRLRCLAPRKIPLTKTIHGKEVKKFIGVTTQIEVFKSSVWKPYGQAPVTIILDYGIDDIRQNLQFIKDYTANTTYTVQGKSLGNSMSAAIAIVEEEELITVLKNEVIDLWEEINRKFKQQRKPKIR
jgi:recombination protein RecA